MAIGETVITIVGNITADPELRTTGQGAQVASFTIANTARVIQQADRPVRGWAGAVHALLGMA